MVEQIITGKIVDTSKNPHKTIEGTRYKSVEVLDRVVGNLDMWRLNILLMTKKIKSAKDYKSPFKIEENRP